MEVLWKMLIFFYFTLLQYCNGNQLLYDFLKSKSIRYLTIINCNNDFGNQNLYKSISHLNITSAVYSFEKCCGNFDNHPRSAVYLNADCNKWTNIVKKLCKNFFKSTYHWLIQTSNYSETEHLLSQIPLNIESDVTVASESLQNYDLYEVYNSGFHNFGTFNSSRIGYWNKNEGVVSVTNQSKYLRRANMTGVVLKCMIVVTNKFVGENFEDYIEQPKLTHLDSMNRFNYALLLHLKDIYNFRYKMFRTNSWGYLHNGTFDGMVGSLQRKEMDIGGSPIFFRLDRAKVIDYTAQTWTSRPCFIFRHPKQVGSFYNIYVRPLDVKVWYCTVALITLTTITLRWLMKGSEKHGVVDLDTSWSYTVLAMLSALCQQGLSLDRSSTATRLTIFTVFVFALTMYQFYSASITSSLLMEAPRNIKTLEDLLHGSLRAGIEDIVYNVDYFSRTTDPISLEIYKKKIVTPKGKNFFPVPEGLAMVKKGGFAFHTDIATAYKIIRETFSEREICELVEIQLFPPQRMVAIVQKGSPYREIITYGLRRMAESGLMHRQRRIWHEPKPMCMNTPDTSIFSVDIYEFSMALLILLCGVVLSLIILTTEISVHHYRMRYLKPLAKMKKCAMFNRKKTWVF